MTIILKWLSSALAVLIVAYILPGVEVAGLWTALILAALLGLFNVSIKPILIVLTLPINILTLGLFTFVINALIILLASSMVKGFIVGGFFNALLFGLFLTVIQELFELLQKKTA
ncbi:MAG: phage holin family protein [Patescibacteria group bacterium]|jgi:putative membrane protein|nr:phage holin family protein [Patescibacteria group bacterium]